MLLMRRKPSNPDDFTVIWKEPDREHYIGRIFRDWRGISRAGGLGEWFWTVDFFQRNGRAEPHQGRSTTYEEAKAAWKRCWESANIPINWPPSQQR